MAATGRQADSRRWSVRSLNHCRRRAPNRRENRWALVTGRCAHRFARRHCRLAIGEQSASCVFFSETLYIRDLNVIFIYTTCLNKFSLSLNFCTRAISWNGEQRLSSSDERVSNSHGTRGKWMGTDGWVLQYVPIVRTTATEDVENKQVLNGSI